MADAGAGVIGDYKLCSFRIKGTGTFSGGESSNPSVGKKGEFEEVEEVRLEMICDKKNLDNTINKMLEIHPYEEPAFEIYNIMVKNKNLPDKAVKVKLKRKVAVKNIFKKVNDAIDTAALPKKIRNTKIKQAVLDLSVDSIIRPESLKSKTLYIKQNKNITNIEII
jgi:hypothetical protein